MCKIFILALFLDLIPVCGHTVYIYPANPNSFTIISTLFFAFCFVIGAVPNASPNKKQKQKKNKYMYPVYKFLSYVY